MGHLARKGFSYQKNPFGDSFEHSAYPARNSSLKLVEEFCRPLNNADLYTLSTLSIICYIGNRQHRLGLSVKLKYNKSKSQHDVYKI